MAYDALALGVGVSPVASPRSHAAADGYYTLVFPAPESSSPPSQPRVSYTEACELLRGVAAGGAERETRTLEELRAAWSAKFRSGPPRSQDTLSFSSLQELVRDVVVARLSSRRGLTLRTRLESNGGRLLLSLRPTPALLRATAERLRLRVPASEALELGRTKLWSRTDAQEELYRLFLAGEIAANEAQLFAVEDIGMWSRRLQALQRRSQQQHETQGDSNDATDVFLPFRDLSALRYVYQQAGGDSDDEDDSDTGDSLFRVADKIRLAKALVDAEFDCDALVAHDLLAQHLCTHSHRASDADTSLEALQMRWGALPSLHHLWSTQSESELDPLPHIRSYFGEELALYFAFASFHARALQALGALALLLALASTTQVLSASTAQAAFCLVSCGLLGVLVRKWELQELRLTAHWSGASSSSEDTGSELLQPPRPQFRGPLRRSPVTLRLEPSAPVTQWLGRRLSATFLLVTLAMLLGGGYALLTASDRFQTLATTTSPSWGLNAALGALALAVKSAVSPLERCSRALTDWENPRLQSHYDTLLAFKFAALQSANSFGALWGLVFLRPWRLSTAKSAADMESLVVSPHEQAARLLLLLLALDVATALWELRGALWRWLRSERQHTSGESSRTALLSSSSSSTDHMSLDTQLALEPYDGVLLDYAQVLLPLGLVACFAPLAPIASSALAWLVAALQTRVDAHRLCFATQRPFPASTRSMGAWLAYLHVLRLGAVLHTAALAFGALQSSDEGLAVALGALFALVGWAAYALRDSSDLALGRQLRTLRRRQAALESKYLGQLGAHLAADARAALPIGRVFLNGVPRYVVTGDKSAEDAAEELRERWRRQQLQLLALERRVEELQTRGEALGVGTLFVEVQGVSLLPPTDPITKTVDSLVQLSVQPAATAAASGHEASKALQVLKELARVPGAGLAKMPSMLSLSALSALSPLPSLPTKRSVKSKTTGQAKAKSKSKVKATAVEVANTSVVRRNRSPQWHERFQLPVAALSDSLALRVCDGGPLLPTASSRRVLGRAQVAVEDIVARTAAARAADSKSAVQPAAASVSPPQTADGDANAKLESQRQPIRRSSSSASSSTVVASPETSEPTVSAATSESEVPLASYELPLELPDALRRSVQSELARRGPPRLALRCGVRLSELGALLVQQRQLQEKLSRLRQQEMQFVRWST